MKYNILSAWLNEIQQVNTSVEGILLLPNLFVLQFKGGKRIGNLPIAKTNQEIGLPNLCIVLNKQDSYPMLNNDIKLNEAKHLWSRLKNATLNRIWLATNDRILYLELEHRDIYQQTNRYTIVAELMPPQPNVILLDAKKQIIDALHKYSYADNPQRQVLANLPYQPPKTSFSLAGDEPAPILAEDFGSWNDYFLHRFSSASTQGNSDLSKVHNIANLKKELKKLHKRHALQNQDLINAEKADYWFACAEAIKPNLNNIKQGQTSFSAVNYLDPNLSNIEVALLPELSPLQNMQLYIKRFHKAKNGLQIIKANLAKTVNEILETETLLQRVENGELPELLLEKQGSAKQMIFAASATDKLLNIKLGDDFQIVIGRKAKENDYITTQLGKPQDYWFHSRIYHGAHVLLRCYKKQKPDAELINLCCNLAAGYSKARSSLNVPVDYTQIRYVRKPRKSAPGYVTYTNYHSVYATPIDVREARELLCKK